MAAVLKRKTSLSLRSAMLDEAKVLGINVSSVAEAALENAVAAARRAAWLAENEAAFAAQAEWHERNGHPLAKIMAGPAASSWKD